MTSEDCGVALLHAVRVSFPFPDHPPKIMPHTIQLPDPPSYIEGCMHGVYTVVCIVCIVSHLLAIPAETLLQCMYVLKSILPCTSVVHELNDIATLAIMHLLQQH